MSNFRTDNIDRLKDFWDRFAATSAAEKLLNLFAYSAFRAQEEEVRQNEFALLTSTFALHQSIIFRVRSDPDPK